MASARSWFTGVLGRIFSKGSEVELLRGLNFTDGFVATPNRATKLIDVALEVEDLRGPTGATGPTGALGPTGPTGAVFAQLTPGSTATAVTTNTIVSSPGVTIEDGYLAFYKGIKGAWVAMNSDGGNTLQTVNLTQRSAASGNAHPHWFADAHAKVYLCTLGIRTKWYADSDRTHSGTVDAVVDVLVTSIGSAPTAISAAVIGTVQVDSSRAHADFATASVQVSSVASGFSITGVRPAGLACHCKADWAVLDFEDIT